MTQEQMTIEQRIAEARKHERAVIIRELRRRIKLAPFVQFAALADLLYWYLQRTERQRIDRRRKRFCVKGTSKILYVASGPDPNCDRAAIIIE